jgi:hypothetical protein
MSLYCPYCWAKARCLDSRCEPLTNFVRRRHQCMSAECGRRFSSVEVIPGFIDLDRCNGGLLAEVCWELADKLFEIKKNDKWLDDLIAEAVKSHKESNNKQCSGMNYRRKPPKDHPWVRHNNRIFGGGSRGKE